jgi:integrase
MLHPWQPEKGQKFEAASAGNVRVKIYRRQRKKARNGTWLRKGQKGTAKTFPVYEVSDRTEGRRRLLGFSDLVRARAEAQRIAGQLASGKVTAAQMLGSEAASYGRAVELLRPTGASLEMVAATFAKCFELLNGDALIEAAKFYALHRADLVTRRTVSEVVDELLETKRGRGKSARYIGDLSARLNKFAESFKVDVSTVTTADVQRWLDGLKVAPQTAKNFRTVLYTLFQFAEARGYVFKGMNPTAGVERISVEGGRIEIYTPKEMAALLCSASKEFLPVLVLGAFAGLRAAETERLEWSDLDLAGGFIHVAGEKAKTRSRRLVPALPNLAAWLAPYARKSGPVWQGSQMDMREARAGAVDKAEVSWKNNGLRHSFISYRLAETQNAAQVALEAGNSPAVVFRHYRELVKPTAAKAWFAIAPERPANVLSIKEAGNG